MYKLVISDDEGKTTVVPLVRDEITIGRKEGNTIRLTERNVSRRHARLRKANGAFVIEDLGSYNGVKINGRRVEGEVPLGAGDQISIGDYQLAVQMEGADAPTAETTAPLMAPGMADAATAMIAAPAAQPRPPARIVMLSPPAPGAEFALARSQIRIGRAEDLDVWVNHRSISREHAEIVRDGNRFRLRDLGSANGVRVNGADVRDALLEAGDMLELGQVRFRFVAEGETYVFDADRTIQVDSVQARRGSRAPIFAAVGIVVVAIAVAVVLAALPSHDNDQPSEPVVTLAPPGKANAATPKPTPAPPVVPAQQGKPETAAVEACNSQLAAGNVDEAIAKAQEALHLSPDSEPAKNCEQRAEAALAEKQTFDHGVDALNRGDTDGAYVAFEELPDDSTYRQRPEVQRAMTAFAQARIDAARTALSKNPAEAARHADEVLAMSAAPDGLRHEAQRIKRAARRAGALASADTGHHHGHTHVVDHHPATTNDHGGGGTSSHAQATSPDSGSHTASAGGGGGGGGIQSCNPDDAQYSQCIIRHLEGRAHSARDLALLIESYRQTSNMSKALQHMAEFVQRYPTQQRAYQYRQILSRHQH